LTGRQKKKAIISENLERDASVGSEKMATGRENEEKEGTDCPSKTCDGRRKNGGGVGGGGKAG